MAGTPKKHADLALLDRIGEDAVRERLEAGQSMTQICKELQVGKRALSDWLERPERAGLLSHARTRAADNLAIETLAIADNATPETANIARLQVDVRKWIASKWGAGTYGEQKGAQVVVNIGDLHLRALKQSPVITIEATGVESNVIEVDALPIDGDEAE